MLKSYNYTQTRTNLYKIFEWRVFYIQKSLKK